MGHSSLEEILGDHEPGHGGGSSHRGRRRRDGGLRGIVPVVLVFVVIFAVAGGSYFGYNWVTNNVNIGQESNDYEGEGTGSVRIKVADGDTGADIAQTLKDNNVIKSTQPFISAFSNNPEASAIKPGTYQLREKMSAASALKLLLDPASSVGLTVTIPEGWSTRQIYARLSEQTGIPVDDFKKAAEDYTGLGVPENPAKSVEGYLWPGTYGIDEEATAPEILTMMVERMAQVLEEKKIPKDKWHETLTLASIAEKEARMSEDYGKVVRTIENRLAGKGEAGGHPMNLQLDSTVAYVFGLESVSTTPEQRAVDSPYNTYKYPGLPVGPISNPGEVTIDAVLNPPEGDWLYWVTVNTDTGETTFSTTKAEHDKAVAEWQAWAKKNR